MALLNENLNSLVHGYAGSVSEVARRAKIDRSTLYKILRGERVPTFLQLQSLLNAVDASTEQSQAILSSYSISHTTESTKIFKKHIYSLLRTICLAQSSVLHANHSLPLNTTTESFSPPSIVEDSIALERLLRQALFHYARSQTARPLFLSPLINKLAIDCLIEAFSHSEAKVHTVMQLSFFTKAAETDPNFEKNLALLSQSVPFLFLEKMQYQAHLSYSDNTLVNSGNLLPVYILFPEFALMMDVNGQKAICIQDSPSVELLRQQFNQAFLQAEDVLFLKAHRYSPADIINLTSTLFRQSRSACWLHYEPPLLCCLDPDLAPKMFIPSSSPATIDFSVLLTSLAEILRLTPTCYFSEDGLLNFVRTGQLGGLLTELYQPLTPENRLHLLRRLRELCLREDRVIRLINSQILPLAPNVQLDVYDNTSIQIFQKTSCVHPTEFRTASICEPSITQTVLKHLTHLEADGVARSQQYTVHFIDSCIRLLL